MRRSLALMALAALLGGTTAQAGDVGVNINLNLGAPAAVPIIVHEPPLFLVPPAIGLQVAVGIPYDMVFIDGRYYASHGDAWYVGHHYNGPWTVIGHDRLPSGLRKHKLAKIREHREKEYRHYRKDKEKYRGKPYRPSRGDDQGKHKGHKKGKHD